MSDEQLRGLERAALAAPHDLALGRRLAGELARAGRTREARQVTCRLARQGCAASRAALAAEAPCALEGLREPPRVELIEVDGRVRATARLTSGALVVRSFGGQDVPFGDSRVMAFDPALEPLWARSLGGSGALLAHGADVLLMPDRREVALWSGADGGDLASVELPLEGSLRAAWADVALVDQHVRDAEKDLFFLGFEVLEVGHALRPLWARRPQRETKKIDLAPGLVLVEERRRAPTKRWAGLHTDPVTALDVTGGEPRWTAVGSVLASDDHGVVMTSRDGLDEARPLEDRLEERALDDGARRWSRFPNPAMQVLPGAGHLLSRGNGLSVLPRGDGAPWWEAGSPYPYPYVLALTRDVVYVATWQPHASPDVLVSGHDVADGRVLFQTTVTVASERFADVYVEPIPRGLLVVIGGGFDDGPTSWVARLTA